MVCSCVMNDGTCKDCQLGTVEGRHGMYFGLKLRFLKLVVSLQPPSTLALEIEAFHLPGARFGELPLKGFREWWLCQRLAFGI